MNIVKPMDIEKKSFDIITEKLNGKIFGGGKDDIVKRVIHTSADFDYADNLVFSDGVVDRAVSAIKRGACVVTDTNMAFSGINKKIVSSLGGEVKCFIGDRDVSKEAKERGVTRAMVSMERACGVEKELILAIGNAPTALIWIDKLVREGLMRPAVIIGVPVGFVNVIEAKELILKGDIPYIVSKGNKGGSNIAAAIVNALIYKIKR
ncbi:MAG: precorrin-8X methylmutase [Clostridiales bacterium]|nr:precorrin-8X methylmutase [Clostridiales bacterium]